MATNFPTGLDSFASKTDNIDDVLASHVNDLQSAVAALEAKLGVNSSAVNTTIDYFLKHASGAYRSHIHDGTSDDGANIPFTSMSGVAVIAQLPYKDEDDMVSDSASHVPTQQSVKAYVDGKTPTNVVFLTGDQTVAGVKTFSSSPITGAGGWASSSSGKGVSSGVIFWSGNCQSQGAGDGPWVVANFTLSTNTIYNYIMFVSAHGGEYNSQHMYHVYSVGGSPKTAHIVEIGTGYTYGKNVTLTESADEMKVNISFSSSGGGGEPLRVVVWGFIISGTTA